MCDLGKQFHTLEHANVMLFIRLISSIKCLVLNLIWII